VHAPEPSRRQLVERVGEQGPPRLPLRLVAARDGVTVSELRPEPTRGLFVERHPAPLDLGAQRVGLDRLGSARGDGLEVVQRVAGS
jgi:hypothetical protein